MSKVHGHEPHAGLQSFGHGDKHGRCGDCGRIFFYSGPNEPKFCPAHTMLSVNLRRADNTRPSYGPDASLGMPRLPRATTQWCR